MTGAFRTPSGGRIDRSKGLAFRFDGQHLAGCEGDTLASALLANGVHLIGRSFKYHRPRGILSAGAEEPNALVTVRRDAARTTPNQRATQQELYAGLVADSQNRSPSLRLDVGSVNDWLGPLLGAGFYYKTFMWPRAFWRHIYEPAIRAMAGLGHAPKFADSDRYAQLYTHCDVLVIGAGPAGLAAARAAAATGQRVILCDEQAEFGGSLLADSQALIDGLPAVEWVSEVVAELATRQVTLLPRSTAFGWYPDNMIGVVQRVTDHLAQPAPELPRERLWQVRARRVIIATGAIERPLVFPGNDRPGVMLADAARTYLVRYGVKVGSNVLIVTADDSAYVVATELREAGVAVAPIVDMRNEPGVGAHSSGIRVLAGTTVVRTSGARRISAVTLSNGETVPCDTLLMSGGWTPSVHLFSQSRGRLRYDEQLGAYVPGQSAAAEQSVGACNGSFALADCLRQGYAAGDPDMAQRPIVVAANRDSQPRAMSHPAVQHARAFVDFQNDVTAKDLRSAAEEGFRSIEHVKRYTTIGMATDQGKTSNLNGISIVADVLRQKLPSIGHTTFRAPYTPVTFGSLAGSARGQLYEPVRYPVTHAWATARGAVFENVGAWQRPRYFPLPGETMHAATVRECIAVRRAVGVLDASTLGKIEVTGPDAAEFLSRLYVGNVTNLPTGRCRYSVLLNEAGFVIDDGILARLAPERFHVTTTTGGAAHVLHHMEDYRQTEFPDLKVWLTSITEQYAVIAVQGPHARATIEPLLAGIDLSAMPHMSVGECRICDIPARLFRVSFTGELGFEINVPADYGMAVWDAVLAAGRDHGITPYGTEAMHILRAEKGYIIVGQETDGTVTPNDLGLDWAIGRGKRDFVGKRSLMRPDMLRPDRKQLVGLVASDPLEEGAQIVSDPHQAVPMRMLGHVTSAYWSETMQRPFALALVAGGRARLGETLYVPMPNGTISVRVTEPGFYDRTGARVHG